MPLPLCQSVVTEYCQLALPQNSLWMNLGSPIPKPCPVQHGNETRILVHGMNMWSASSMLGSRTLP